ncbi:hypothetical protein BJX65DRAFT_314757 [Aspergillus insuetus]
MAKFSRDRAKDIVNEIYNQSGGFLTSDGREGALAQALGAPVREAAEKACTVDKRFLYEMIQNAEDCSYVNAISQGHDPFLAFYLYPNLIVVESNEDGFEESDVRAICSPRSQRKQGKIGEKGIGFKSVFKVASKVQIQSGPFCFSIQHLEGEPGLGMISPVNEPHDILPPDVRTRFTLSLLYPGKYRRLESEVAKLPVTINAFLSKLKKLHISLPKDHSENRLCQTFTRFLIGSRLLCIKYSDGKMENLQEYFYFSKKLTGTPSRESRPFSQASEITMAFPYTLHPASEEHFAHAYLPLRKVGLNFLIQADFVTQDDRELLADCPWNDHLLTHLPQVFLSAVKTLSEMPEFETSWPRFLPNRNVNDPQRSKFHEAVKKDLRQLPLFKTRKGNGNLKSLENVRYLLPEHCDRDGDPLFNDGEEGTYLSSEYTKYYKILESFGLQPVSSRELLDRFRPYFEGWRPKFLLNYAVFGAPVFHKPADEDWHDRVAVLLLSWMDSPQDPVAKEIGDLALVPVYTQLKSPKTCPIYFPYDTEGNLIPHGLVDTVNMSAMRSATLKRLFVRLGVRHAKPSLIVERIYPTMVDPRCIRLYDSDGGAIEMPHRESNSMVRQQDVYFRDEQKYGMAAVLKRIPHYGTDSAGADSPSMRVRFLHPRYTAGLWSEGQGANWAKWLQEVGAVRRAPRLEARHDPRCPSLILIEMVDSAPDMVISVLKANWDVYTGHLTDPSSHIFSTIATAQVPVECGTELLCKAFIGTPEQKHVWADEYLKNKFPFLTIPIDAGNDYPADWEFLSRFGVNTSTEAFLTQSAWRLYLILPRRHAKTGFFKLYELLADNYFEDFWKSPTPLSIVYIARQGLDDKLVRLADCVWNSDVPGKYRLDSFADYRDNHKVKEMFQRALCNHDGGGNTDGDRDSTALLAELSRLQGETDVSSDTVRGIYELIMRGSWGSRVWRSIRKRFESDAFIYVPDTNTWYPPSRCAWTDLTSIKGKYGVRRIYTDLKPLFIDKLRILRPDTLDHIEEMHTMGMAGHAIPSEVLDIIKQLSGCNPSPDDFEALKLCRFLPIRRNATTTTYGTVDERFLILDDDRVQVSPGEPVLDFTPEDVCRLRRFFSGLGLEERYVSRQLGSVTYAVSDAQESVDLTRELRQKSESLYRIAIHFGSKDCALTPEIIRQSFSRAIVYTAVGFCRHFTLGYDPGEQLFTGTKHKGRLHAEYTDGILRIYVPRDERERKICYATELSRELVSLLEIDDQAARGMFATVLREPVEILDDILQEEGIIRPALTPSRELVLRSDEQPGPDEEGFKEEKNADTIPPVQQSLPIIFDECTSCETTMDLYEFDPILRCPRRAAKRIYTGSSYLTTLTKKYNLTELDVDHDIPSVAADFFQHNPAEHDLTLTESALRAAAIDRSSETMALLTKCLEKRQQDVAISETVLQCVAKNEECGDYILHLLLSYSLARSQPVVITDAVLEYAARNEPCGDQVMSLLLDPVIQGRQGQILISEAVLEATFENTEFGDCILTLFLEYSSNETIPLTEDLLIAAVQNEDLGHLLLSVMLNHDCQIPVSPVVLAAAAANLHEGPALIGLLLPRMGDDVSITNNVIIAAVYNEASGLEVLKLLKQHNDSDLPVTEDILIAIAGSEIVDNLMKFWHLDFDDDNTLITQAVLEFAAKNPACTKQHSSRLLRAANCPFEVTSATLISTMEDMEKCALILDHAALPEQLVHTYAVRVLVAAAASLDYCLEKSLLLKLLGQDMPIPVDVLEFAAGNPIYGYDVVKLLLGHYDGNLQLTESVLLAAATNPRHGAEVLQLLLQRQPDVQVTDDLIAAAAVGGNGSLQPLIRHRSQSTLPQFEVTETLLEAVVGNIQCNAGDVQFLLDTSTKTDSDSPLPIPEAALIAAAGNIRCGYDIMSKLLDHGGPQLQDLITENVLIAAAGNPLWGLEILALLFDWGYILGFSSEVIAAAEGNIYCGREIIAFLLRYQVPPSLDPDSFDWEYCEDSEFSDDE